MTMWEQYQERDETQLPLQSDLGANATPYVPSAEEFTSFLSRRPEELSSKDVAQTIWAIGRLESVQQPDVVVSVPITLRNFVSRIPHLCSKFTTQEVANILWGLSRTGFEDDKVVHLLTTRLLYLSQSSSNEKPKPEEASIVMYSLARMNIQDKEVFSVLSNDILDQLEDASAHAIANALWAYRAVRITPPPQLLDGWATQKLGLVAVQPCPTP
jgi:hypothetical protein